MANTLEVYHNGVLVFSSEGRRLLVTHGVDDNL